MYIDKPLGAGVPRVSCFSYISIGSLISNDSLWASFPSHWAAKASPTFLFGMYSGYLKTSENQRGQGAFEAYAG